MKVLLPTLGSAGDVHPFLAIGQTLRARGHVVEIITNPVQPTPDAGAYLERSQAISKAFGDLAEAIETMSLPAEKELSTPAADV